MKYYFVINPMAGKKKDTEKLKKDITDKANKLDKDFELYITKSVGDATDYVNKICQTNDNPKTFIACGGDGTFNEVLNGAYGFDNVFIGVLPSGTGNDFCRNFKGCDFKDIESQLNGTPMPCDVICYKGIVNGEESTKYCANMFNIGFDCNAADLTAKLKKYPFIKGSLAYLLGVLGVMIKKKGANLKIEIDDDEVHNGKLLLTAIANGCFCGGGIKSNPYAIINDGFMDVNIIKDIPRILFIPCLPQYMNGTIFENKKYKDIAFTKQCKKIVVTPNEKMRLCVDGEIFDAEKIEFELIEKGINFIKPTKKGTSK